jgi:DNA replication protein DnaC
MTTTTSTATPEGSLHSRLKGHLKDLHLPTVRESYEESARRAEREHASYEQYLLEVVEQECAVRRMNRISRLIHESGLPLEKTFETFKRERLPRAQNAQVSSLLDGSFLDRKENLLLFGRSGAGKSHLLCAIAHELIQTREKRIRFTTCTLLVQELLIAKRDLKLARYLKRMNRFDAVFIDQVGYEQQSRDEMEVLFTLLAERYERGSVMLTSNLPFSRWDEIFKDPTTTAAAIDRLIHHSVILELNLESYRLEESREQQKRSKEQAQSSEETHPAASEGREQTSHIQHKSQNPAAPKTKKTAKKRRKTQ